MVRALRAVVGAFAILGCSFATFAAVELTTITGDVYCLDGSKASAGTVTVKLAPAGVPGRTSDGANLQVVASEITAQISALGAVSLAIVPNDAIQPAGTTYQITYNITAPVRSIQKEFWYVTTAPDPVSLGSVQRVGGPALTLPTITGAAGTLEVANGSSGLQPATGYLWNSVTGSLYAPAQSGAISQGYSSASFTPGRSHWSDLAAARAHASLWGDPDYYTEPAVFDTWNEIFLNHPLYADCDNNATAGGAGCVNEQPAPLINKCYAANCTTDVSIYCITTTDATANGIVDNDNDGTPDFAVGDVVLAGQSSGNISKGGPTHRIVAISTDNANCSATGSDNAVQVDPAINQNSAWEIDTDANGTVDSGVAMVRLWKNDTHPTNVGTDHMGFRLLYAPRLMYGRHGPNLLRNGSMDWNTVTENITASGCTVTARTWTATPTTGLTDRDAREGPAYNSIDCGTSVTATDYLESTDAISVMPGERYVLSGLLKAKDRTVIALVDDRNNDTTFADAGDMQYQLAVLQPGNQFGNMLAPFWASFEIPVGAGGGGGAVGIHRVKVRWRKGGTTVNDPQLDMFSLRKVTTWDTDSTLEGGRATSAFLINDPGTRNIVVTGDSWVVSGGLGEMYKQGMARAALARFGRDISSQIKVTGVGGISIVYILDNFYTMIEQHDPLYVVVQIGTNDVVGGTTQANFIARARMLAARIQSIGAIPIFQPVAPLGPAGGANMTTSHNFRDALWRALMN